MSDPTEVGGLVEGLFRHESGRIVATLVRLFGPDRLDVAEDAVQEALVKALRLWPYRGVPERPTAWLTQVARNAALDRLRRESTLTDLPDEVESQLATPGEGVEDQIELLVRCCNPCLSLEAQIALTLKTVCGFSTAEIARAFLVTETTIAQRIVRAKRAFALPFDATGEAELEERLDAVLRCLYLVFNEGYSSTQGEFLLRRELCEDAIRLVRWLAGPPLGSPKAHALLSLMLFQRARFDARLDAKGALVPLEEQSSAHWNRALMLEAFYHLALSTAADEESEYHLQAAIAAEHTLAPETGWTDWEAILELYDRLEAKAPTPVVALNRAIALGMARGPEAGMAALAPLAEPLARYCLFYATRARWRMALGRFLEAESDLHRAVENTASPAERECLQRRLAALSPQSA